MTYCLKRLLMHLQGFRNQPSRKEVNRLYDHYRNEVMDSRIVENHLAESDFNGLVAIAEYGHRLGKWTAVQAAFCLGFRARKDGVE